MIRLVLIAVFICVVVISVTWLSGMLRMLAQPTGRKDDSLMPAKFQQVTYVLLVILLFGVSSGWLGGT